MRKIAANSQQPLIIFAKSVIITSLQGPQHASELPLNDQASDVMSTIMLHLLPVNQNAANFFSFRDPVDTFKVDTL